MVAIMADKEIHSADIIIQVSLKECHSVTCLIQIYNNTYYGHVVTAMDTHGSWHTNLASFVLGISKGDIASETGSLWRVIAVTKVLSFFVFKREIYLGSYHTHNNTTGGQVHYMGYG